MHPSLAASSLLYAALLHLACAAGAQYTISPSSASAEGSSEQFIWTAQPGLDARAPVLPLRASGVPMPVVPASLITFFRADSNPSIINGSNIAFISCDPSDYQRPGNIGAAAVYGMAVERKPAAVILYTNTLQSCQFSGGPPPNYDRVWSLAAPDAGGRVETDEVSAPTPMVGAIGYVNTTVDYARYTNMTAPAIAQQQDPERPQRPNINTQVAMIILYTVTGIVTALFAVIITTGAIRAHRNPERYGPRNILGRPRQTRARGLARAMLDSLPIVKFSDPDAAKHDQRTGSDTELAEGGVLSRGAGETPKTDTGSPATAHTADSSPLGHNADGPSGTARATDAASVRSGIGPAQDPASPDPDRPSATGVINNPAPGCSICTDDFQDGEDLRVLPCNHRFHPACVDPWLLNVSGTCPLCRIDLRQGDDRDGSESADGSLPPPLEMVDVGSDNDPASATAGPASARQTRNTTNRRSVILFQENNREETLTWLRGLRERHRATTSANGTQGAEAEESSRRRRLSRAFGIRTRREGRNGSVVAQPPRDPSAGPSASAERTGSQQDAAAVLPPTRGAATSSLSGSQQAAGRAASASTGSRPPTAANSSSSNSSSSRPQTAAGGSAQAAGLPAVTRPSTEDNASTRRQPPPPAHAAEQGASASSSSSSAPGRAAGSGDRAGAPDERVM